MLYINFNIPSWKKDDRCFFPKNIHINVPNDRAFELSYGKMSNNILDFELSTKFRGGDHAGPSLMFGLFGYGIEMNLPKGRHWNYDKNEWLMDHKKWTKEFNDILQKEYPKNFVDFTFIYQYYEDGKTPEEAVELFKKVDSPENYSVIDN